MVQNWIVDWCTARNFTLIECFCFFWHQKQSWRLKDRGNITFLHLFMKFCSCGATWWFFITSKIKPSFALKKIMYLQHFAVKIENVSNCYIKWLGQFERNFGQKTQCSVIWWRTAGQGIISDNAMMCRVVGTRKVWKSGWRGGSSSNVEA